MKFGYKDESLDELINYYSKEDNKIIIRYLDGSIEEIPFTKMNEDLLIQKMLIQAGNRRDSDIRSELELQKELVLGFSFGLVGVSLINSLLLNNSSLEIGSILNTIFGSISSIGVMFCGIKYITLNSKLKELEKYDIYLSMYEDLERNKNKFDMYRGIEKYENLNINTIDNFTLEEIKQIKNNFDEYEEVVCKIKRRNYITI